MIKLKGKITSGYKVATKTIKRQSKHFEKKGIKKNVLISGSINVNISPRKWEITNPDFEFKNIVWKPNFAEDFNFVKLKFKFQGKEYKGYLYNPKRTKNPKTIMEILAKHIDGIEYGKKIELILPKNKIKIF